MPKHKYDPAWFDALDDEQKQMLIRDVLEDECHNGVTYADLVMMLEYYHCYNTGE